MTGQDSLLIRSRDVMEILGVTKYGLRTMIQTGVLAPVQLWEGSRGHFLRSDVEKLKQQINAGEIDERE